MAEYNEIKLLNIKMHALSVKQTIIIIKDRIDKHIFTQHVVINVAKLINMKSDFQLRKSVEDSDIINIDGMGVVWGARFLGENVPERVSGIDLFLELLALAEKQEYPVFLLGAKDEVVKTAEYRLKDKFPALQIAGCHHGYFWEAEETVVNKINRSGARLLFVAITSPKKENFINKWKDVLGVDFVMGVGGTFDVISGVVKRAPVWMQNAGLEWLYRVMQEPARMWERYFITNTKFAIFLLTAKLRMIFSND